MAKAKRWIAIAGSWRKTSKQVENDVRDCVKKIINEENGVVTGGALNVDSFATDEVLKLNPTADHIKIFLPVPLNLYAQHYRKRANDGVITQQQAENLIAQLFKVKALNSNAIHENQINTEVNKDTYFERITKIIDQSDELVAFQVNKSEGVQDTIEKAKTKGIPVKLFTYTIE